MTLKEIEYGSIASSADMNDNFTYINERVSDTISSVNTSISSILSNIATINTRISELAEDLQDSVTEINSDITGFKNRALLTLNKISMLPNWSAASQISSLHSYTADANGFILILPAPSSEGSVTINSKTFITRDNSGENTATELIVIPVAEDDTVSSTIVYTLAYFVPSQQVNWATIS